MNGGIQAGVSDYSFHVAGYPSTAGEASDFDDSLQFGSQNNESYSFNLFIDPGEDAAYLPRIWGQGMGLSDQPIGNGISIYGIYRGVTSQEFGRVEGIEFSMVSDNIKRGEFRLYGTE
jgi:hypothetical protein